MIRSRKELDFYIKADCMMNRGYFRPNIKHRLMEFIKPDYVMRFLNRMRKVDYYTNCRRTAAGGGIMLTINKIAYRRLSIKLGFSIGSQVFGYGLVIPHYGTIVVGESSKIGNYAVLHTATCITNNGKQIGDGLYLSTGAKLTAKMTLGNNVSIAANSVVTKSYVMDDVLLAGVPAIVKAPMSAWYIRDGETFKNRVEKVERLKKEMNL